MLHERNAGWEILSKLEPFCARRKRVYFKQDLLKIIIEMILFKCDSIPRFILLGSEKYKHALKIFI